MSEAVRSLNGCWPRIPASAENKAASLCIPVIPANGSIPITCPLFFSLGPFPKIKEIKKSNKEKRQPRFATHSLSKD
jgi:hypothetical protein